MQHLEVDEHVILAVPRDALLLIAGSVGEACDALTDCDSTARVGFDKSEARRLRSECWTLRSLDGARAMPRSPEIFIELTNRLDGHGSSHAVCHKKLGLCCVSY